MSGSLTRFLAYSISCSSRFFLISSWYRPKNLNFLMLCCSDHQNIAKNSPQFCICRLRVSGCRGCVLSKIFSVLRVRLYRILFSSGQSVYNIRFIEGYFVQITRKLFNMALNSQANSATARQTRQWMQITTNHFANFRTRFSKYFVSGSLVFFWLLS